MNAPKRPKFLSNIEQLDDASLSSDLIVPTKNEKYFDQKPTLKLLPVISSDRCNTDVNTRKSEQNQYTFSHESNVNATNVKICNDQPQLNCSNNSIAETTIGKTPLYQHPKFLSDVNMLDDATLSSDYIPVEPLKKRATEEQCAIAGSTYHFPIPMPIYSSYGQYVPYILNNGISIITNTGIFQYPQQQPVEAESNNQTPIEADNLTISGDQLSVMDNIAEDKSIEYAFTGQQLHAKSSSSAQDGNANNNADFGVVDDVADEDNEVQNSPQSQNNLFSVPSHLPLMHLPKRLEAVLNATNFDLFNTLIKQFFLPDCIFRTTVMEQDESGIDAIMKCYAAVFQAYPDGVFKIRKVQFDRNKRLISVCLDFDGTKRTVSDNEYMINYVTHGSTANLTSESEPQPLTHRSTSSKAQSELLVDPQLRNRALDLLRVGAQYRVKHRSTWHWLLTRPDRGRGSSSQQTNQSGHEMMVRKFFVLIRPVSLNRAPPPPSREPFG